MKLTRKKAIELCIELWKWLAKTGKEKEDWPKWLELYKSSKRAGDCVWGYCWFCEYDERMKHKHQSISCEYCPLTELFGAKGCSTNKCYFTKWEKARFPRTRKKYAKLFLEQIKSIEQGT